MPFNVAINEDLVFKASIVLLSFLALLWMFIMVVILWLRKIQLRVDKAAKVVKSWKQDASTWPHINNAFAYSAEDMNGNDTDFRQRSFECLETEREHEILINGLNKEPSGVSEVLIDETDSATVFSSNRQPGHEKNSETGQLKMSTVVQSPAGISYAKLREDSERTSCLDDEGDLIHGKHETIVTQQSTSNQTDITDENDYLILIGENKEQSGEGHPEAQHKGKDSAVLKNNNIDRMMGVDASQNEIENEYLAIIHTDEALVLPESPMNTMPRLEDESEYLIPIETVLAEKRHHRQEKDSEIHSEIKHKAKAVLERLERVALLPVNTPAIDDGLLSPTENTENPAQDDRKTGLGFQQTEQNSGAQYDGKGTPKSSTKGDHEYIYLEKHSKKPGNQSITSGIAAKGVHLRPGEDEEDYDYITTRQGKEWTVSSNNASKAQEWSLSPDNALKPQENNPSKSQEAHYVDKDTTGHVRDERTAPCNEHTNEYIEVIPDEEFQTNGKNAGEEVQRPGEGEEDYDYITTRQGKEWTVSSNNASKAQEWSLSPDNALKPQENNPSKSQEAHYVDKDTTGHVRDERTAPCNEHTNEYIEIIPDEEFQTNGKNAGEEVQRPGEGEEDYDYITTRQGKEWTVSSNNASKAQEWSLSPDNALKPQENNPSKSQEAHYVDKDTTGHVRDERTAPCNEHTNEYIEVIPDEEFQTNGKNAGEEVQRPGEGEEDYDYITTR